MPPSPFIPIHRRLIGWVLWLALVGGGVAVVVQTLQIYRSTTQDFQRMVVDLGKAQVPLLSLGLWDVESVTLQQQIEVMAERPELARLVLVSSTGLRLEAGHGESAATADARLPIPPPEGGGADLGELQLFADHGHRYRSILFAAGQRIIEIALFTGLICLLIASRLRRELGQPLQQVARYVATLSPYRPQPPMQPQRSPRVWHDEIDLVTHGFETLRIGLQHYAAERDAAIAQLSAERDLLDRRVEQRTAALQRINLHLDYFSRTLMRCIHLPLSGYREALQQALGELCEHLGARAAGLAIQREGGWHCQVASDERWVSQGLARPWQGQGWLVDPECPELQAYRLDNSLMLLACAPSATDDDDQRYRKMAAEMLFSLLERWQHAAQLDETRRELERLSRSDPLTGLANRRHFDLHWEQEVRHAVRHGLPVSVLMLDVDHFKAYNDHYGHGAGDLCLVTVADCLRGAFQCASELPARLGGEEFAVLLPGRNAEQAHEAAERLRQSIFELALEHRGSPLGRLSVSIGYATLDEACLDQRSADLVREADRALYVAKTAGRNQVRGVQDAMAATPAIP